MKTNLLLFFFAFSIIIGPGYNTYLHYDFSYSIDAKTYIAIAKSDFKDQSITRRYRVLVPFVAEAIAYPISKIYTRLWPQRNDSDWPLRLAFLIVNCVVTSLAALVIFHICRLYGAGAVSSFMAMMAVLVSSWTNYTVGIPMTDSLYLLIIALTVYGIKAKNAIALICCIFIGPFAKESFIFIAPIIFFWGCIPKWKQVILFILSATLVFGSRWLIDLQAGTAYSSSFLNAFDHTDNFSYTLHRVFAFRGLGELFTILGTFTFIILAGFTGGKYERNKWVPYLDWPCLALIFSLIIHAILSGEVSRMLYFGAPVWAIMMSLILDRHKRFEGYRKLMKPDDNNTDQAK